MKVVLNVSFGDMETLELGYMGSFVMLGLPGDDGILWGQASGNKFSDAGSWANRAFGQSMFTWVQYDLGSIGPWRLWTFGAMQYKEHIASGTWPLFHYYQPGSSGKLKCVGPCCLMIMLRLQLCLGF